MMGYISQFDQSLLTGIFWLLAGVCGMIRHFLLEPRTTTYPRAPAWLLAVFFAAATFFIFLGLRFVAAYVAREPGIPPQASPSMMATSMVVLIYQAALLANILRQHYPAHTWKRLNRIQEIVRCSPGRTCYDRLLGRG